MRSTFKRRHCLAAMAAAGTFLPAVRWAHGVGTTADSSAARLVSLFKRRDSARAIGSIYLAARPEEADTHKLVKLVIRGADDVPLVVHHTSDTELRAWFRERQARDFATGRIVNLDGWLLSATEVRICALAALT